MNSQKRYLLFSYLLIGLFCFFGSNIDRVERAQFLGKTIFFPVFFAVNEYKTMKKLVHENKNQQLLIGDLIVKTIKQETLLNKYRNSKIDFTTPDSTFVLADVVGFSGDFFGRTIIISKGLFHGVRANNPVFATKGIVGKVIVAYQNFSVILPLDHPSFKLAVLNKNSGVQGILVVDVYSTIAMSYMRFGSHIAVGDTIITSNLSHIFPAFYPVGSVVRLEESSDALYLRAVIEPFNDIKNLQHVYVLLKDDVIIDNVDIETNY